ncbi:MAG: NAD(P)-dependent oxidoreductase [Pseudomonadota bacterium]
MPCRLLVLGGGGRLGRLLQAAARARPDAGSQVTFQSRHAGADLVWHPDETVSYLPAADCVVGLWGVTGHEAQDVSQNTTLARRTAEIAHALGADVAIHLSSAAVYGSGRDMDEAHTPCPTNAYGRAKLDMEQAIGSLPDTGVRHWILRLANVIGADSLAPGLQGADPVMLDRFPNGCGPERSYITASDVLQVLRALASHSPEARVELLNVAAPHAVTMDALARAAGQQIIWRAAPDGAAWHVSLSTTRLRALLPDLVFHETPDAMIADWRSLEPAP